MAAFGYLGGVAHSRELIILIAITNMTTRASCLTVPMSVNVVAAETGIISHLFTSIILQLAQLLTASMMAFVVAHRLQHLPGHHRHQK